MLDAAGKKLPAEIVEFRKELPGAKKHAMRKGDDSCYTELLTKLDLNTTQERFGTAWFCRPSGQTKGPAWPC